MPTIDNNGAAHDQSGRYTAYDRTAAAVGLSAPQPRSPLTARTRDHAMRSIVDANKVIAAAERARDEAATRLAIDEIRRTWPDATTAYVFKDAESHADDGWRLASVIRDDDVLYDSDSYDRSSAVFQIDDTLSHVREATGFDFNGDETTRRLEEFGRAWAIDLTKDRSDEIPGTIEVLGLDTMNLQNQNRVLLAAAEATGQVLISVDKNEAQYFLEESPEDLGITADTGKQLDAKFGSRAAALAAVVGTEAWQDFQVTANDAIYDSKRDMVRQAIAEALSA